MLYTQPTMRGQRISSKYSYDMIEKQQNEYFPDMVSPPGETLEETLKEQGMSQVELATRMGRPHKTINEIVNGKTAITPETALQLERVLGVPARFWLKREQHYRQWRASAGRGTTAC